MLIKYRLHRNHNTINTFSEPIRAHFFDLDDLTLLASSLEFIPVICFVVVLVVFVLEFEDADIAGDGGFLRAGGFLGDEPVPMAASAAAINGFLF